MQKDKIQDSQSVLLDLIRYFLAAIVVIGHGLGIFLGYFGGFFPKVFPHLQSIAVVCFFYLSGYLIVGSQLRQSARQTGSLWTYLFDRATRVYVTLIPSLLFVAIIHIVIQTTLGEQGRSFGIHADAVHFAKNALLIPSMPFGTLRPIWSLMYEWWIYLLFGGLYFLRTNPAVGLILTALGGYNTFVVNAGGDAGHIWLIWAIGGLCAHVQQTRDLALLKSAWADILAVAMVVLAALMYYYTKQAYDLPAGIVLSLALFLFTARSRPNAPRLLSLKTVAHRLAGYSFTLFLTHYTVLIALQTALHLGGWSGVVISFILANLIAYGIALGSEYRLGAIKAWLRERIPALATRG